MRTITIHPLSLVAGAALAAVVFISMSQSQPPAQAPMPLRVEYIPHPRDFFRIEEGTSYTVPVGKIFVLTGLGIHGLNTGVSGLQFVVNGLVTDFYTNPGGANLVDAPRGMTYLPSTALQLVDNTPSNQESYAVGYLVNQ